MLNYSARTNYLAEGWNSRFQSVVGKHHPSLYAFFEELKAKQEDTEEMLHAMGRSIKRKTERKRRQREDSIKTLVSRNEDYNEQYIHTYLKSIGSQIEF